MSIIKTLKTVFLWGWAPALITAIALVGMNYSWDMWLLGTIMGIILLAGLIIAVISFM